MKIRITLESTHSGVSYFEKFIRDLPAVDRAAILAVFQDIRIHGFSAKGCSFRQIDGRLWEIKMRASVSSFRFFYVMVSLDHMHVLHSYKKQGQKAPRHQIEVAKKRLKRILK